MGQATPVRDRKRTPERETAAAREELKWMRSRLRQILDIWDDHPGLAREQLEEIAFEDVADAPLPWGNPQS